MSERDELITGLLPDMEATGYGADDAESLLSVALTAIEANYHLVPKDSEHVVLRKGEVPPWMREATSGEIAGAFYGKYAVGNVTRGFYRIEVTPKEEEG